LNFNGENWLKKFIPTFVIHSQEDADIYVIDNGSSDDSLNYLKNNFPAVKTISLEKNLGFAGGYNEGLKKINAEFFIIVNSDVEVTKKWILPLIKVLKNNENISAVQPKIKSYKNKDYFEYAGAAGGFIDLLAYPFCRGRVFDYTELDKKQYDTHREIFWASGACMAIKSRDFKDVGGFDKDFFAHMEEIDLCWRLKNLGKNIFYTSESTVYHFGGGTLKYSSPKKTYLNYRNNLWMIHKNFKGNTPLFLFILIRILMDQISGIKLILSGDIKGYLSIVKAHLSYLTSIGKMNVKRKQFSKLNFHKLKGYSNKSTIWNYFFLKKKTFSEMTNQ
tara:strand:- start:853 stop:1851 length:999 start_codon:yes stop_codon:yes gene_type:complete